ncbi:MAG: hypothetical protein GX279_12620 [Clostridiaceae bacterium]|nr:hypothetical protein [Clostridiaceae bacterium]
MKNKSVVIIALAVILVCVSVIAFSVVMRNKQEQEPDGQVTASDKDGESSPKLSQDNAGDSTKTSDGNSSQQSGGIDGSDVNAPDDNGSEDEGMAGSEENNPQDEDMAEPEDSLIAPEDAKNIIAETADLVLRAIAEKDFDTVSEYAHPDLGVRFTPYTFVYVESDLVFSKNEIKSFLNDGNVYHWGYYDGSGEEIRLTTKEYYERFIYTADYVNAPEVGYNEVLSFGNMLENQFEIYKGAIIVEYYFPQIDPQYEGLDWRSLRLVFQKHDGSWKLTGLINNQWTI